MTKGKDESRSKGMSRKAMQVKMASLCQFDTRAVYGRVGSESDGDDAD